MTARTRWEPSSAWAKTVAYQTLVKLKYGDDSAWWLADQAMRAWEQDLSVIGLDRAVALGVAGIVAADLQAQALDALTALDSTPTVRKSAA